MGVLPTTYKVTTETRLVQNEDGTDRAVEISVRKPIHNRVELSLNEREAGEKLIRAEYRVRHMKFRERRRLRKASKEASKVMASVYKATSKK